MSVEQTKVTAQSLSHVPTDKDIADLQVKKATVQNEIDALCVKYDNLSVQYRDLENKIKSEQNIYDLLSLKTTAELQEEADKKLIDTKSQLQLVQDSLAEIDKQIKLRQVDLEVISKKLSGLSEDHRNRVSAFNTEIKLLQDNLGKFKEENSVAFSTLSNTQRKIEEAKDILAVTTRQTQLEREKQQEYAAFLDRKTRDLTIWEKRLNVKFQEINPGESLKFV